MKRNGSRGHISARKENLKYILESLRSGPVWQVVSRIRTENPGSKTLFNRLGAMIIFEPPSNYIGFRPRPGGSIAVGLRGPTPPSKLVQPAPPSVLPDSSGGGYKCCAE